MQTIFDLAEPKELDAIYLAYSGDVETLEEIKNEIENGSGDAKRASLVRLYIFRDDNKNANKFLSQITDKDYIQSIEQEMLDAGMKIYG